MTWLANMTRILKEQVEHRHLILRLSLYEIKSKNRSNLLGSSWEILNLLIQLAVYWFVFQNVRKHEGMTLADGTTVPYFYWLLIGFVLWMFFYKATIDGSSSIYSRVRFLSKMQFPMSVVPSYVMGSYLMIHLVMLGITFVVVLFSGKMPSLYLVQLVYFLPATLFFLFGFSLITSTLSAILRDVHMLLNAGMRILLYLSPILWEIGTLGGVIGTAAKANPLYYLIEGYRAAFFGTEWYMVTHWELTLYFWALSLVVFLIGSALHTKFRRHFVDFS